MLTRRDFLGIMGAAGLAATQGCGTNAPHGSGSDNSSGEKSIDRLAVLARNSPRIQKADPTAVLSVGNGNFAFNVDCTGVQTLAAEYKVIPLATLSHWGWHSNPLPAGVDPAAYRYQDWPFHGRNIPLATSSTGQTALNDYLRANPHRLNLGRIGLVLDGRPITIAQLSNIDQRLDLATGIITSRFELAGKTVEVITCCAGDDDIIGLQIASSLVADKRLSVQIVFPYGSTESSSDGGNWSKPGAHTTTMTQMVNHLGKDMPMSLFAREVDAFEYALMLCRGSANASRLAPHTFDITSSGTDTMGLSLRFMPSGQGNAAPLQNVLFNEVHASSTASWRNFWSTGAAIDFSSATDPRAPELERRIVLSQYLTAIHCAGPLPSQETGLLCNSWFGKFHLEMHWWHSVHFTVWNRHALFANSLPFYQKNLDSARARAKFQGFAGARWPKMTDPGGADSPSPIGPLLIWQQPHPIYYAELCYRHDPSRATLEQWRDIVLETANFMASFAFFDAQRKQFILGPSIKTVPENETPATTFNPTYEVTCWRFGLLTAQKWLQRLGQPRNAGWDKILALLAPAPTKDGLYLLQENQDTYSPKWATEHPAHLGALGVLPGDGIDPAIMAATVRKVRETWDFAGVWGWDFPMAALAAARTGQPELAIDFLFIDSVKNTYFPNGCNYQRENLPAYFPGNGGLLSAIGLMAGGWTGGPKTPLPGFPKNGKWNVRAEGFNSWI